MISSLTAKHFRIGAETVAISSLAFSFVFFLVGPFYSSRSGFPSSFFIADAAPYVAVAVAAFFAKTRSSAAVCLLAALCSLAVGVYTYLDWTRVSFINEIDLFTSPLKWLFALTALLAAGFSFLTRILRHASNGL
jgi:Na+/melibiose symporter-like transporter